jgi:hypothetical protein
VVGFTPWLLYHLEKETLVHIGQEVDCKAVLNNVEKRKILVPAMKQTQIPQKVSK